MYIFKPIGPVISVSWSTGGARNVTFATNGGTVKTDFSQPVSIDSAANPKVFEAYSYDKGQTVYVHYVGQFS